MPDSILTQETLKDLLHYNPGTGIFTWLKRDLSCFNSAAHGKTWNTRWAGKPAGAPSKHGYIGIAIFYKHYWAHRLAWIYMYGEFPQKGIDHINHSRSDNRIINLRSANQIENSRNQKLSLANRSGVTGVHWHKSANKWVAQITVNSKPVYLGLFTDKNDAISGETDHRRDR